MVGASTTARQLGQMFAKVKSLACSGQSVLHCQKHRDFYFVSGL